MTLFLSREKAKSSKKHFYILVYNNNHQNQQNSFFPGRFLIEQLLQPSADITAQALKNRVRVYAMYSKSQISLTVVIDYFLASTFT